MEGIKRSANIATKMESLDIAEASRALVIHRAAAPPTGMQDPRAFPLEEASKSKKRKSLPQMSSGVKIKEEIKRGKMAFLPSREAQKGFKRSLKNDDSPPYHQTDASTPDSLPDSSGPGDEYRTLRHRYLVMEEESFAVGKELSDVEAEVKALEDEKFALLDQLVVLEGLLDPSEVQPISLH